MEDSSALRPNRTQIEIAPPPVATGPVLRPAGGAVLPLGDLARRRGCTDASLLTIPASDHPLRPFGRSIALPRRICETSKITFWLTWRRFLSNGSETGGPAMAAFHLFFPAPDGISTPVCAAESSIKSADSWPIRNSS